MRVMDQQWAWIQWVPRLFLAANDFHGNVRFGLLGNDLPRLPDHLLGDAIVLARALAPKI
jgi:hypothetical protein